MAYTWIKLYTEILDDPKVEKLPDSTWRFMVKIFLIAGKGGGAQLPSVDDLVMLSRKNKIFVEHNLTHLASVGILTVTDDGHYVVTNFSKRQSAMSPTERQRRHRSSNAPSQSCHEIVTEVEVEEEEEVEEDSRERLSEPVAEKLAACKFKFNPNSGTIIQIWKDDFPDDVILRAIDESVSHGARSISYVDKILISWKANGVPPTRDEQIKAKKQKGKPNGQNSGPAKAPPVYSDEERELGARLRAEREARRAELVPAV